MYYLIETDYCGPNPEQHRGAAGRWLSITREPGRTNMSHEPRTRGWLGTTNDWYSAAHGEYQTEEDARDAAASLGFEIEAEGEEGEIARLLRREDAAEHWEASDWFCQARPEELGITADSTDEELRDLAREHEELAEESDHDRPYGAILHNAEEYLRGVREQLQDERGAA